MPVNLIFNFFILYIDLFNNDQLIINKIIKTIVNNINKLKQLFN